MNANSYNTMLLLTEPKLVVLNGRYPYRKPRALKTPQGAIVPKLSRDMPRRSIRG